MKLYKISEPNEEEIVVGIDLGTTNSLVSYYDGEKIKIIPDKHNEKGIVPSVVSYANSEVKVGYEADQTNCIKSVKRLIGKGTNDSISHDESYNIDIAESSSSILKINANGKSVTPVEVSAEILKYLKKNAEDYIGKKVSQAVITVPAHFDDAARLATKDAAKIAGLEVLRVLNEPTAAAIAYGLNSNTDDVILVFDLGGGTFDVSILKNNNGVMVVVGTGGDNNLGGDDFDRALLELMYQKKMVFKDLSEGLKTAAECKKYLSENEIWTNGTTSISLDEALAVWKDLIDRALRITREVIFASEIGLREISHVILAGGSTKMHVIQMAVEELFKIKPLMTIDPDLVVAIGAGLQAKSLTHGGHVLVDVVPLSLGIELLGQIVEPIIARNTPIPAIVKKYYTTYQDNQTGFKIHVVQGEGETVEMCRSLGRFELSGLPKKPAGEVKLEVIFKVDADGILVVTATETETGKSCEIEMKPSYGLTDEEVKNLMMIS